MSNPEQKLTTEDVVKPGGKIIEITPMDNDMVQIMFKGMEIRLTGEVRLHFESQPGVQLISGPSKFGTHLLAGLRCPIEFWLQEIEKFSPDPKDDKAKFLQEINQMKHHKGDDASKIQEEMVERMERETEIHPTIKKRKK